MDLIKKLTGKNPDEYEGVAKSLVDNSDVNLFAKLVKQDDFLFDFVKNNVANRIKKAVNQDNYLNLLNFLDNYSPSYDSVIAECLYNFGGIEILPAMKEIFVNGNVEKKAYALKYFSFVPREYVEELLPLIRQTAVSEFEPLSINSIEVLSKMNDEIFKTEALQKLNSEDEFEQYNGVKYLVAFKALDALPQILQVMKKSSLSENIASEIPYLVPVEDLIKTDDGVLVLCNIVSAIPEIIPPSAVIDYNLFSIFEDLYLNNLSSSSAVLLRLAQEKFAELTSNDEYLYDCDKNTKDEVFAINQLLVGIDSYKLKNLLYDELYDESEFVFFAVDFVDEAEELEALLDTKNPTLILKVLLKLKDKQMLTQSHKDIASKNIGENELKQYIEAL
ncbi:TPA: hypothetical protein CPT95_02775 [Candidatus Gastranaerophilales bacterium HUM_15]|jgi:hypothetical protein|nr:unknown [Acinetobacter sp. CAG:196]DAB10159.1 MAG TPA: hypothetical protein CPT95_02775 [Candidatus Gastranaerophilales bacterium HUM_15]DAB12395.1 MAG TPA: hypothetical protein CPU00_13945 [Candidatus Gastranaerophilales bacterium HUM_18]